MTTYISVPLQRVPIGATSGVRLIGRDGQLERIHNELIGGSKTPSSTQLTGGGGIGKTALALEYCYEFGSNYEVVFWVDAESSTTSSRSFELYVAQYNLVVPDGQQPRDVVNAHLARQQGVLVVYDNVEDRDGFAGWSPPIQSAHILVTSRSHTGWSNPVRVELIDPTAARDWLLFAQHRGTQPLGVAAAHLDQDLVDTAAELAAELDGLALALTMATTLIHDYGTDIDDYLAMYRDGSQDLLDEQDALLQGYAKTVYGTVEVAIRKLIANGWSEAQMMLELISFYAPNDIPKWIFSKEALDSKSPIAVEKAVKGLLSLSLITAEGDFISVHRLTQDVTRYYLKHGLPVEVQEEAIRESNLTTVLTIEANPSDGSNLGTTVELREIEEALQPYADQIVVKHGLAVNSSGLVTLLRRHNPTILHFCGHSEEGSLLLHALDDDDASTPVEGDALNDLLALHDVTLVVLNSCYSHSLATQLNDHVPIVIGTTDEVDNQDARLFATSFYGSLAENNIFNDAFNDAVASVNLEAGENVFVQLADESHAARTLL